MSNPIIYVTRDALTKLTEAECTKRGLPFTEYPDIPVEVEGHYTPAERGHRDRYGAPEEPDYPEGIEDISGVVAKDCKRYDPDTEDLLEEVWMKEGEKIELTDDEQREAEEAILEQMREDAADAELERQLDRAESRYDY